MVLVLAVGVGVMVYNLKGSEMIFNLDSTQMLLAVLDVVGGLFILSHMYKYLKTKV